jgi:hypothetical protein
MRHSDAYFNLPDRSIWINVRCILPEVVTIAGGIDVEGAFADFILADLFTGSIHRTGSTPHGPAQGVVEGVNGKDEIDGVTPELIVSASATRADDGRLQLHSVRRCVEY